MRIALFSDTFSPQVNGVAMTMKRLVNHLEHRKIPHLIFIPKSAETSDTATSVRTLTSMPFFLYPECRLSIPRYFLIRNQLDRFRPDVLHIATPLTLGWCGLQYARRSNLPHIISYHTNFDRYLDYYKLQALSSSLWGYMRWFHSSCSLILTPSEETRSALLHKGFSDVEIWSRGVDAHLFSPEKQTEEFRGRYGIPPNHLLLLYVGRMAPEKDLDVIPDIISCLPSELQRLTHWFFVGDGPMRQELESQVKGTGANAVFTGYLKGEELAEAYASADLFVFPSTTETFGNVVLEALASGTPAICARSGGVQEIVQDGVTGRLCEPWNALQYADAIQEIAANPFLKEALSRQARRYALTRSWEVVMDRLLLQYEEVMRVSSQGLSRLLGGAD